MDIDSLSESNQERQNSQLYLKISLTFSSFLILLTLLKKVSLILNLSDSKVLVLQEKITGRDFTMMEKIISLMFMTKYKLLKKKYALLVGVLLLTFYLKDHKALKQENQDWIVYWVEQQKEELKFLLLFSKSQVSS